MSENVDLRVVELLAARLCHDLISPIAAIGNGVELLGDEDPDFAADALRLVGESARNASRRLQFLRFAYGFTGGGLAGLPPFALLRELLAETNLVCSYGEDIRNLPLEHQKLACNMILLAAEGLPRGGRIEVRAELAKLIVCGFGEGGPAAESREAIGLQVPVADLTSRSITAYFAALLACRIGRKLRLADISGGFVVVAEPEQD